MMVMMAVMARPAVELRARRVQNTVLSHSDGQADPRRVGNAREVDLAQQRPPRHRLTTTPSRMGTILTMPRPQMLHDHDDSDGHNGNKPVCLDALAMAELARIKPDGDDDGASDHRREEAHDALGAEHAGTAPTAPGYSRPGASHAQAGVRQKLGLAVGRDGRITGNEGERRAQERRHLTASTGSGTAACPRRRTAALRRRTGRSAPAPSIGGAEHGEHVLQSEDRHLRRAELARIVNCIGAVLGPHGRRFLFAHLQPLISRPLRCRMLPRSVIRRARLREPLASCHKFAQCAMPKRPSAC